MDSIEPHAATAEMSAARITVRYTEEKKRQTLFIYCCLNHLMMFSASRLLSACPMNLLAKGASSATTTTLPLPNSVTATMPNSCWGSPLSNFLFLSMSAHALPVVAATVMAGSLVISPQVPYTAIFSRPEVTGCGPKLVTRKSCGLLSIRSVVSARGELETIIPNEVVSCATAGDIWSSTSRLPLFFTNDSRADISSELKGCTGPAMMYVFSSEEI